MRFVNTRSNSTVLVGTVDKCIRESASVVTKNLIVAVQLSFDNPLNFLSSCVSLTACRERYASRSASALE